MKSRFAQFLTITLASFAAFSAHPAEPALPTASEALTNRPTAKELLHRFAEEQAKLNSFIAEYEFTQQDSGSGTFAWNGSHSGSCEARFDGLRCSHRERWWGQIEPRTQRTQAKPYYRSMLYDGRSLYQYDQPFWRLDDVPKGQRSGTLMLKIGPTLFPRADSAPNLTNMVELLNLCGGSALTFCLGVMPDDWRRFDSRVREASSLSVRQKLEPAGAEPAPCYVLEADTRYGRYTIWLDPTHGFQVAKAILDRIPGRQRTTPGQGYTLTAGDHDRCTVDKVRFAKRDGVWVTTEGAFGRDNTMAKAGSVSVRLQVKVTKFLLNPDHEALRSFLPDDIRNGSIVASGLATNGSGGLILCRWRDGQALDPKGKVVFDSGLTNTNSAKSISTGKD